MIKLKIITDSAEPFIKEVEAFINRKDIEIIKGDYCVTPVGFNVAYFEFRDKEVKNEPQPRRESTAKPRAKTRRPKL